MERYYVLVSFNKDRDYVNNIPDLIKEWEGIDEIKSILFLESHYDAIIEIEGDDKVKEIISKKIRRPKETKITFTLPVSEKHYKEGDFPDIYDQSAIYCLLIHFNDDKQEFFDYLESTLSNLRLDETSYMYDAVALISGAEVSLLKNSISNEIRGQKGIRGVLSIKASKEYKT